MVKICALLLVALVASGFPAITRAQATPEAVATAYADAIRTRGMESVPEFIHPDELSRFKAMLLPIFEGSAPSNTNLMHAFFGPDATFEKVAATEPPEFMRIFMSIAGGQMKSMNVTIGKSEIIGSVKEGIVVHLVTRNTVGAGPLQMTQLEVVSLKPYQDTWRLLLSGKLDGMAQALKAQAAKPL